MLLLLRIGPWQEQLDHLLAAAPSAGPVPGQRIRPDDYLNFIDTAGRLEERGHMLKSIRDLFIYFRSDQFFRGHPDAAGRGYFVVHDSRCNVFTAGV
jgi:hypothetical protein